MSRNEDRENPPCESEEGKVCRMLRVCIYCLLVLAFLRLFTMQILWMINDLLSAGIIYCTYVSKGKFISLFCMINAILGLIYVITGGFTELNSPGEVAEGNKNESKEKDTFLDKEKNNSSHLGNADNYPGNYYSDKGNSNSSSTKQILYRYLLVLSLFQGLVTYSAISYYSYKGYNIFQSPFGEVRNDPGGVLYPSQSYNDYGTTSNYAPNNSATVNRTNNVYGYRPGAETVSPGFNAFQGRGTVLGGNQYQ